MTLISGLGLGDWPRAERRAARCPDLLHPRSVFQRHPTGNQRPLLRDGQRQPRPTQRAVDFRQCRNRGDIESLPLDHIDRTTCRSAGVGDDDVEHRGCCRGRSQRSGLRAAGRRHCPIIATGRIGDRRLHDKTVWGDVVDSDHDIASRCGDCSDALNRRQTRHRFVLGAIRWRSPVGRDFGIPSTHTSPNQAQRVRFRYVHYRNRAQPDSYEPATLDGGLVTTPVSRDLGR
jgi:hypothetical protein